MRPPWTLDPAAALDKQRTLSDSTTLKRIAAEAGIPLEADLSLDQRPAPGSASGPSSLEALLETIRQRRTDFDSLACIPADVIAMMKQAGIFRASTPAMFGGAPLCPAGFMRTIERIAAVDGSAAWVASFGAAGTYLSALPIATQRAIYSTGPDQVFAGGFYPAQRAQATPGGWTATGRWRFASGCKGADWIGISIEVDGPRLLTAVARAAEVEIVPNWDVVGLQGTGSHDAVVTAKFYPEAWTFPRGAPALIDEPLFRFPKTCLLAAVHAVCNVGLARAALDLASGMGGITETITGAPRLADRGYYRMELARAEAAWRGARAFLYDSVGVAWEALRRAGEVPPPQANLLRLAATHAAHTGANVASSAYRIVGMAAVHKTHRLQQIVRDTMVVTQHMFLSEGTLENAGAMLAGMPPDGPAYP